MNKMSDIEFESLIFLKVNEIGAKIIIIDTSMKLGKFINKIELFEINKGDIRGLKS